MQYDCRSKQTNTYLFFSLGYNGAQCEIYVKELFHAPAIDIRAFMSSDTLYQACQP